MTQTYHFRSANHSVIPFVLQCRCHIAAGDTVASMSDLPTSMSDMIPSPALSEDNRILPDSSTYLPLQPPRDNDVPDLINKLRRKKQKGAISSLSRFNI